MFHSKIPDAHRMLHVCNMKDGEFGWAPSNSLFNHKDKCCAYNLTSIVFKRDKNNQLLFVFKGGIYYAINYDLEPIMYKNLNAIYPGDDWYVTCQYAHRHDNEFKDLSEEELFNLLKLEKSVWYQKE
ncbi:MAG: hypothetical protein EOM67_12265 [Spirochaetia bacterium]|nr:hypothetical protein [Spirochaetia bacterium]